MDRHAPALLLVLAIFVVFPAGCRSSSSITGSNAAPKYLHPKRMLTDRMAKYTKALNDAYHKADWERHSALTTGMLAFIENEPSDVLVDINQPLKDAISENGVGPYVSVLIEYGYRLGRAPTARTKAALRQLARLVRGKQTTTLKTPAILLRTTNQAHYFRPYSENAGRAVLALMFSGFGERHMAFGYRPEQFLRVAQLLAGCKETQNGPQETVIAKKRCMNLAAAVAGALADSGAGNASVDPAQVAGIVKGGVTAGMRECLADAANEVGTRLVQQLEDELSCREKSRGAKGLPVPISGLGSGASGASGSNLDLSRILAGMTKEGEDQVTFFSDFDLGVSGIGQYNGKTSNYKDPNDPQHTVRVTGWVTWDDEVGWSLGTSVTETTSGGATTTRYDSQGRVTGVAYYGLGDNAGTEYHASFNSNGTLSSESITDEDGTTTTVAYNSDGSTTPVKYDKDGNCISNCANTSSSPAGEFSPDRCALIARNDVYSQAVPHGSHLGSLIIPTPDAPLEGDVPGCLAAFTQSSGMPHCPSVALCLEGDVGDDCKCGSASHSSGGHPPHQGASRCAAMNCGAGTCNAETGTCSASTGSIFPAEIRGPAPGPPAKPQPLPAVVTFSAVPGSAKLSTIRGVLWKLPASRPAVP